MPYLDRNFRRNIQIHFKILANTISYRRSNSACDTLKFEVKFIKFTLLKFKPRSATAPNKPARVQQLLTSPGMRTPRGKWIFASALLCNCEQSVVQALSFLTQFKQCVKLKSKFNAIKARVLAHKISKFTDFLNQILPSKI